MEPMASRPKHNRGGREKQTSQTEKAASGTRGREMEKAKEATAIAEDRGGRHSAREHNNKTRIKQSRTTKKSTKDRAEVKKKKETRPAGKAGDPR
jgi:hypothetical protein